MKTATIFLAAFFSFQSLKSQDFWERRNFPGYYGDVLAISLSGHLFLGVSGLGLFRSENDGDSWISINEGLTTPHIRGLAIDSRSGTIFASGFNLAGTENGVFRSTNNGNTWSPIAALTNRYAYALAVNQSGHIFAGTARFGNDTLLRSTDGGETWLPTNLARYVGNLAINANGYIFACSGPDLYRSADSGSSWVNVRPDSVGGYYGNVAFSPVGGIFLTEYEPGEVGMYSRIWRSTDKGYSWTIARPWSFGIYRPLATNSKGHVFAASSEVIRSTNSGMTWEDVSSGLPRNPGYGISSLVINSNGRIFASSIAVFRSRVSTTSAKNENADSPTAYVFEQNYPNPFNPSTKIAFSMPVGTGRAPSVLKVYDVLGREVRTLVNKNLQAGRYEVTFDGTGLASGVYFYRLDAGAIMMTKKMLLIR